MILINGNYIRINKLKNKLIKIIKLFQKLNKQLDFSQIIFKYMFINNSKKKRSIENI